MNYMCYYYYLYVTVYRKLFMLTNHIQNKPNKEKFDILDMNLLLIVKIPSINSLWHLSALMARAKVSPIWLVRSQQLCRGAGHIGLTIKLYSSGNDPIRLIIVSRSWISLCRAVAETLCDTAVWQRDVITMITYILLYRYVIINVIQLPGGNLPTLHILLRKMLILININLK